jgi:hypothetical protein
VQVIRWDLVSAALAFYREAGFRYVEVPWIVSRSAMDITRPEDAQALWLPGEEQGLVGSAEQSFLEMHLRGELPLGKYLVAASPCFRPTDDDSVTCHQPTFFKVELGYFLEEGAPEGGVLMLREVAKVMRLLAARFLHEALGVEAEVGPASPPEERGPLWESQVGDLLVGGAEIGSYGVRRWRAPTPKPPLVWAFGTGLAEPRTSWAVGELSHRGERPTL